MPTFFRILLALWLACNVVESRTCYSMDIRSVKSQFNQLKNCTKVVGFLQIVLLEGVEELDSFPELVEITGYLIIFSVPALSSLGDLFPNLAVIRGNVLLKDAALILYKNENMTKLGSDGLLEIQRGRVVIMHCSKLCYVNTVNWSSLGTTLDSVGLTKCSNEKCPENCHGNCWSHDKCQKLNNDCHSQCLGCSKPNSPNHCVVCKNFKDGNTCVKQCPPNKFQNQAAFTCHTKEECYNLPKGHFTYKNLCIRKCPKVGDRKYKVALNGTEKICVPCIENECTNKKICNGILVETKLDIEHLHDCTHIIGHLEFKLSNSSLLNLLEKHLGEIQEIEGCLKIGRSSALKSLDFLKYLKRIRGRFRYPQCNGYAVFVYENRNLQKLWDFNKNFSMTVDNATIGFHDNPLLCLSQIEEFAKRIGIPLKNIHDLRNADVSPTSNGDKATCRVIDMDTTITEISPYNVTLCWDIKSMINITFVGYTIFYTSNFNVSRNQIEMDVSYTCGKTQWQSKFVSTKCYSINELKPFTTYYFYIKVYSTVKVEGSSTMRNFTTLPNYPSPPKNLNIKDVTNSSFVLTWLSPELPNGILNNYVLIAYPQNMNSEIVNQRDYCKNPHQLETMPLGQKSPVIKKVNTKNANETCNCEKEKEKTIENVCDEKQIGSFNKNCKNYLYGLMHLLPEYTFNNFNLQNLSGSNFIRITIPPTLNSFKLENLEHFTTYVLTFFVCNKNLNNKLMCSRSLIKTVKTLSYKFADNITNLKITVKDQTATITWENPVLPNGVIVSYNIENINDDSSGVIQIPQCFANTNNYNHHVVVYKLQDLDPGSYAIRMRAISLAGPGFYTSYSYFKISRPLSPRIFYITICLIFFIIISICCFYLWYKHKINMGNIRLIASINPDYESGLYMEDSWELDRSDVDIGEEIGQGTFGLVYVGYIKSKNKLCAIKTLNNTALQSYRTSFLNEASVMKSFSEAHHVIKLFGVVSRGDPPLVVMELMERGDLKQYLRKSRESSQTITSNEMYRMASQIADGMTYLSAKKYVHRDLAARNCMVAHDHTVKIGDFGMTRDVYETDYYKKGTKGLLPVRWMAPESLADGIFTTESDVWSYGIVLWEIITLAEQPYQGMANEQVLNFVIAHGRLNRPPDCPDLMYEIMKACWTFNPKHRPLFTQIVEKLEHIAGPSFNFESFYHSREGTEYRLNIKPREVLHAADSLDFSFSEEDHLFDEPDFPFRSTSLNLRSSIVSSFD